MFVWICFYQKGNKNELNDRIWDSTHWTVTFVFVTDQIHRSISLLWLFQSEKMWMTCNCLSGWAYCVWNCALILLRISHHFHIMITASSSEVKTRTYSINTFLLLKGHVLQIHKQWGHLNISQSKNYYIIYLSHIEWLFLYLCVSAFMKFAIHFSIAVWIFFHKVLFIVWTF